MSDDDLLSLLELRIKGLEKLRNNLGDKNISYSNCKGYELFFGIDGLEKEFTKSMSY